MSLKSKAKAEVARKRARLQRELETQALEANAQRLKTMSSGFAKTTRTAKQIETFKTSKMPNYNVETRKNVVHASDRFSAALPKPKQVMSPEMEAREAAAQERYSQMKKLVQPLYNKGGLQYPDQGAIDAAKAGELRRRS